MITKAAKILAKLFTTFLIGVAVNSAHAGGVVGDLINSFAPGVGTELDQANAVAGQNDIQLRFFFRIRTV
jgi:hypothetical protein